MLAADHAGGMENIVQQASQMGGAGMSGIVDCEERIDFNLAVSSGSEFTVDLALPVENRLDEAARRRLLGRYAAAAPALVVIDVAALARSDIVHPEADLVVIASAVPVLRPVKVRWRWMAGQEMNRLLVRYLYRHVPVALRGERQHRQLVFAVEAGRQVVARQVTPQEARTAWELYEQMLSGSE